MPGAEKRGAGRLGGEGQGEGQGDSRADERRSAGLQLSQAPLELGALDGVGAEIDSPPVGPAGVR
jgi:hypothetical protein